LKSASIEPGRAPFALLKGERLIAHNLTVGIGTITAGVLGFAFQAAMSHRLRPSDFGAVFAAITLMTLIGLPAGGFTLLMAREASHDRAEGAIRLSAALLRRGNRALLIFGGAIAGLLVLGAPALAAFLGTQTQLMWAAAVGVPFGLALPLLLGELQGEQRFLALSMVLVAQAALKLIAAAVLAIVVGPVGVIAGISAATIATYAAVMWLLRPELSIKVDVDWWQPAMRYLAIVIPSSVALAVLVSADVLLVKHFFPSQAAGEYSAVAALGRAIFWGASGVAWVAFPKVVFRRTRGQQPSAVIGASLVLVVAGGMLGLAVLAAASRTVLTVFAGSAYAGAAVYLPWYAIGMTLLGVVSVLIASLQSQGRAGFLAILIPLTALQPLLVGAFHQSLLEVVAMVDLSIAAVAAGLALWYVISERASRVSAPVVIAGAHAVSALQAHR